MATTPEVRYARSNGDAVAYQVWGEGPDHLLVMTNWPTSVDNIWEHPGRVRFLAILGSLARVIRFDPRGLGASDPLPADQVGGVRLWVQDCLSVLGDVGATRVSMVAEAYATHPALLLAAERPELLERLTLLNGYARLAAAPEYPMGHDEDAVAASVAQIGATWGTGAVTAAAVPTLAQGASDPGFVGRTERLGASRATATAMARAQFRADSRDLLPDVTTPTTVIHTGDFGLVTPDLCRYVADNIVDATYHEVPSRSFYWGESDVDDYAAFVGEAARPPVAREIAAILFTDIVGSTPTATALRDRRWRQLLDGLDAFVDIEATKTGGRVVKQIGDGHVIVFSHPAAAVQTALAILRAAPTFQVGIRAGIHMGQIEHRRGADIAGIAVHIAQRVAGLAPPSELLVSRTVADLLAGSGLNLEDRGEHQLKGVAETWRLYAVAD